MSTLSIDIGDLTIKSTPVVAGALTDVVSTYMGLTLHEWFYVTVILYTIAQTWAVIYTTLDTQQGYQEEGRD